MQDLKKQYWELEDISSKKRKFLICNSCFWCASYLTNKFRSMENCPTCNDGILDSMPISSNETYKFDCDVERGVTLEFGRTE